MAKLTVTEQKKALFCNKLVHYDIPWSLMLFQQRNGRIDRYGQTRTPYIAYLMTLGSDNQETEDNRILKILIEKDKAVVANIGDPALFYGVYNVEQEEEITAKAMEEGSAEALEQTMEANVAEENKSFLDTLLDECCSEELHRELETPKEQKTEKEHPTLYENDFAFARAALQKLNLRGVTVREEEQAVEFCWQNREQWCSEFKYRFRHFPKEIIKNDIFRLSASVDVVKDEIDRSHKEEVSWPAVQYLWELHPIMSWLFDKVASTWQRNEAPVLYLSHLSPGESIILLFGSVTNRKGWPLVVDWLGCRFFGRECAEIIPLEEVLARTQLRKNDLPNLCARADIKLLDEILPEAVDRATAYMNEKKNDEIASLRPLLTEHLERLRTLRDKHVQKNRARTTHDRAHGRSRLDTLNRLTNEAFSADERWVKDTLSIEDSPYIQVVCACTANLVSDEIA